MEQEQTTSAQSSGLIYKLNDRPPLKETLFAALQHLLAIFVAIITPPLIIAGALKLDLETTGYLVSMALFASGISTFIQCRRVGPIGCGLLCIQGTSFSFIGRISSAVLTRSSSSMQFARISSRFSDVMINASLHPVKTPLYISTSHSLRGTPTDSTLHLILCSISLSIVQDSLLNDDF